MSQSDESSSLKIAFTLNGQPISVEVSPDDRLLDTIRHALHLRGTKECCGEGECGACTVLLDDLPVHACLVPSFQVRDRHVSTVESIDPTSLDALHESGATQCGACSPGVVVMAHWIRKHPEALQHGTLEELMAGNVCRCTGYDGILEGVRNMLPQQGDT